MVRADVDFRGTKLWILICAIFVASLGLNTNSTAVIIGAMLISPLMGPIIGFGTALGIYDFELLKKSLRNLGLTTLFSVLTATIYVILTPITDSGSELLGRTQPNIYDVLIAFFGGAAGMIAASTKSRASATGSGYCYGSYASALYRRIRYCHMAVALLLWGFLPVPHQLCFYRIGYLSHGATFAFPQKSFP